ncbi:MAG: VWA domain-containing protein [Bacteroidetes bacterium]|nr:VWA domain-containing protein [Bacteroidota bacterium]
MTTEIDPELRRLPVYLVLDTSSSMMGHPIESVKEGVKMSVNSLSREPWAKGMVWISIITFNSEAEQIIPLTEVTNFPEANLIAKGMTDYGYALRVLTNSLDKDLRKRTSEHRGDYKPVIYFLTDGYPTISGWEQTVPDLHARKYESLVACAAGSNADEKELRKITETVIRLQDATPESLSAFIQWVSQSILTKSRSAGLSQELENPELPKCADYVDSPEGYSIDTKGISETE